jgi:hypothetical protein
MTADREEVITGSDLIVSLSMDTRKAGVRHSRK